MESLRLKWQEVKGESTENSKELHNGRLLSLRRTTQLWWYGKCECGSVFRCVHVCACVQGGGGRGRAKKEGGRITFLKKRQTNKYKLCLSHPDTDAFLWRRNTSCCRIKAINTMTFPNCLGNVKAVRAKPVGLLVVRTLRRYLEESNLLQCY